MTINQKQKMISKNTLTHPKHKKYKITAFEENYCWVVNLQTGTSHRCFPLDHNVGDEVWLFEKSHNIFNGNITFSYSILNLYLVGHVYEFNVTRDGDKSFNVSNYKFLNFPAPISCRSIERPDKEKLLIVSLDLEANKPVFASPYANNTQVDDFSDIDLSAFEEGKKYELPVHSKYTNKKSNLFLIVVHKGVNYHISVPAVFSDLDFGNNVECYLGHYEEGGKYALKLTRYYIVSKLYKEGEKYSFRIKDIKTDSDQLSVSWLLEDDYGYHNLYLPDDDFSTRDGDNNFKIGDYIDLYVRKINQKGYLTLVLEKTNIKQSKYIVEDVFKEINFEGYEIEYFYNLYDEGVIQFDEETQQKQSYLNQYHEGENLWIFSYFSFLDEKIVHELEDGEFIRAKTLIEIYIRLEKWLIYSSDYLKNFLPYKAAMIIEKAERKINSLEGKIEAIDLYLNDEDQKFIEAAKKQVINTRYLPKNKIATIKELARVSSFFVEDSNENLLLDTLILLLKNNLLSNWDRFYISKSIANKIVSERERIIDLYQNENNSENSSELATLLKYQYLLLFIIVREENIFHLKLASVNLLRFLTIYHNDKEYLKIAIELLVKDGFLKTNISKQENVFNLTPKDFEEMIVFSENNKSYYRDKGRVIRDENGLTLFPKNHLFGNRDFDASVVTVLKEHNIFVKSYYIDSLISPNQELGELLQNVLSFLNYERVKIVSKYGEIDENQLFKGKVKGVGSKDVYCFLSAKLDKEPISPLLHVNSFNKSKFFDNINAYVKPNDIITFNILKIEDKRIEISPAILLENYAEKILKEKVLIKGLVLAKYHSKCLVISQEGWPLVIYNPSLIEGQVIEATVNKYENTENAFLGVDAIVIKENFIGEPVELYRQYLINVGMIMATPNNEKIPFDNKEDLKFDDNFRITSKVLIECLDHYRKFITDENENIIYFFVLAVLSSIVKHSKSYYFVNKLENLAQINKVEKSESIEEIVSLPIEITESRKSVENKEDVMAFKLLQFFASDVIDIPIQLDTSSRFYKLKKLIEANNLLRSFHDNGMWSKYFKNLIIKELYAVALDNEINPFKEILSLSLDSDFDPNNESRKQSTNLGSESKTKEFKSSLFYSASDEPQEKVILRTISGFLNGYENASLFIGVNDSGDVIGIKKDLQFDPNIKNLDQYQNYIQTLIVNAFPKEVNQHLDYIFHKVNNMDYLEIVIPRYDKPVSFNNEFYQRQGVQTRILKGNDLTDFMFRKATINNGVIHSKESQKSFLENEMLIELKEKPEENTKLLEQKFNFDFYTDQKKEGNESFKKINIAQDELLAYLYIYDDDSYMISLSEFDKYLFKIPIIEKYRFGYLLMCYDNACVNKVEIRSILSKQFNKKYLNGLSDYGKLMSILPAKKDDEVVITVVRNGHNYIKIMNVNRISAHRILGLKGNCIVQEDIDQVLSFWSTPILPVDFDPFRRDSKQGMGADASKFGRLYKILTKYLDA